MNFNDIISIAAVITTTVVAVVSIFLNHRSNLNHQLFLEKLRIYKELMVSKGGNGFNISHFSNHKTSFTNAPN